MSTDVTSVTKSLDRIADALEGGSSAGSFYIHATITSENTLTDGDKTAEEIESALESGLDPVLITTDQYGDINYLRYYGKYMTDYLFSACYVMGKSVNFITIAYGNNYVYRKTIN